MLNSLISKMDLVRPKWCGATHPPPEIINYLKSIQGLKRLQEQIIHLYYICSTKSTHQYLTFFMVNIPPPHLTLQSLK